MFRESVIRGIFYIYINIYIHIYTYVCVYVCVSVHQESDDYYIETKFSLVWVINEGVKVNEYLYNLSP